MSNNLKFVIIAVVAAVAGGGFFLLNSDDASQNNNESAQSETTQQNSENSQTEANSANPLGIDTTTLDQAYRITIESTVSGAVAKSVVDSDGNGNSDMTITSSEGSTRIIIVDGVTYMQNAEDGSWIKFPASSSAPVDTSQVDAGLTPQDVEEINTNSTIVDKGKGSCSAGECRIYESIDKTTSDRVVIKVHDQTNRISDMEITSSTGEVTKITYDYTVKINIVAPEGAIEFGLDDFGSIPQ